MKKLIICVVLSTLVFSTQAQNVIRGKIVDSDGVPIPGAKVSVKGGIESTLSEFDGSYQLITGDEVKKIAVDYVGYNPRTVKVLSKDLDIVMKQSNLWNRVPSKMNWLVSAQSAFPESFEQPSFGLMVGCVKKIGAYVKAMGGFLPGQTAETETGLRATLKTPLTAATGGLIIRLGCALHLTVGGGYAARKAVLTVEQDGKKTTTGLSLYSYSAGAADLGFMLVLGHFNVNAGAIIPVTDGPCFIGNFGIGFNF